MTPSENPLSEEEGNEEDVSSGGSCSSLPEGWIKVVDSSSGALYYLNKKIGAISREHPGKEGAKPTLVQETPATEDVGGWRFDDDDEEESQRSSRSSGAIANKNDDNNDNHSDREEKDQRPELGNIDTTHIGQQHSRNGDAHKEDDHRQRDDGFDDDSTKANDGMLGNGILKVRVLFLPDESQSYTRKVRVSWILDNGRVSYPKLEQMLSVESPRKMGLDNTDEYDITLTYKDFEGEVVTVFTSRDLKLAMEEEFSSSSSEKKLNGATTTKYLKMVATVESIKRNNNNNNNNKNIKNNSNNNDNNNKQESGIPLSSPPSFGPTVEAVDSSYPPIVTKAPKPFGLSSKTANSSHPPVATKVPAPFGSPAKAPPAHVGFSFGRRSGFG